MPSSMSSSLLKKATPFTSCKTCLFVCPILLVLLHTLRKPTKAVNINYDISQLLNVPSFINSSLLDNPPTIADISDPETKQIAMRSHSLLSIYRSLPSKCNGRPFLPHLRQALKNSVMVKTYSIHSIANTVRAPNVLLVHFESGSIQANGTSLSETFLRAVVSRSAGFSKVVLMGSVCSKMEPSCNQHEASVKLDAKVLKKRIKGDGINAVVYSTKDADNRVYLMHIAANLLVHRGSLSALGALVNTGRSYYTDDLAEYMSENQFRWLVHNAEPAVDPPKPKRFAQELNMMGPVVPTCCNFQGFGVGDGEKIVCTNSKRFLKTPCWVLSVGCNNKWSFEESIVKNSECQVHTFDCTGKFTVPPHIRHRVTLHHLCLGVDGEKRDNYVGWDEMLRIGSEASNRKLVVPALAKMDIEGAEFRVLNALLNRGDDAPLPEQLAVEIHVFSSWKNGMPFNLFERLKKRGYLFVHRADNPYCAKCSEVTLLHKSGVPPSS